MKKFKYLPPYKASGKTNFPETQKKSGAYLIKENGKIVYVGMSGVNLYKTLYRHFQIWNHRHQPVVTYVHKLHRHKYTVRVILCTPKQAARLEKALILKYKPRDCREKYQLYKPDAYDKKVIQTYEAEPVINSCPF